MGFYPRWGASRQQGSENFPSFLHTAAQVARKEPARAAQTSGLQSIRALANTRYTL